MSLKVLQFCDFVSYFVHQIANIYQLLVYIENIWYLIVPA